MQQPNVHRPEEHTVEEKGTSRAAISRRQVAFGIIQMSEYLLPVDMKFMLSSEGNFGSIVGIALDHNLPDYSKDMIRTSWV